MKTSHANRTCFNKRSDLTDTQVIQSALDSGKPKVVLHNIGRPWKIGPVVLRSDQTVVFRQGCYIGPDLDAWLGVAVAPMFRVDQVRNVHIIAHGSLMSMDGVGGDENRHCLKIMRCKDIAVEGVNIVDPAADGVYVGYNAQDVYVKDFVVDHAYRNCVSITGGNMVFVENGTMRNAYGTSPRAGLDIEPNEGQNITNCFVRDCQARNNFRTGFYVSLQHATDASVELARCYSHGSYHGFRVARMLADRSARVGLVGCRATMPRGYGLSVHNKALTGGELTFSRCKFGKVVFTNAEKYAVEHFGNIQFRDCDEGDIIVEGDTKPEQVVIS